MYECFACIYISALHAFLVPVEARGGLWGLWNLGLRIVVSCQMYAGKEQQMPLTAKPCRQSQALILLLNKKVLGQV